MRLIIPGLGTELTLVEPWTFRLFHERRNIGLGEALEVVDLVKVPSERHVYRSVEVPNPHYGTNPRYPYSQPRFLYQQELERTETVYYDRKKWLSQDEGIDHEVVTLPAGTVLKVDRIYIRKIGRSTNDYSSIAFRVQSCPLFKRKKPRFWAKLSEVNRLEVSFVEETLPQDV